jgi:ankyrin repeat protein
LSKRLLCASFIAEKEIESVADIEDLLNACRIGDLSRVQFLLNSGIAITSKNERGWTPLSVAAYNQQLKLVKMLLSIGADPNAQNINGTTVLMYAKTHAKDFVILDVLLEAKANLNATDKFGKTILDYAVSSGRATLIDYLLSRGATSGLQT